MLARIAYRRVCVDGGGGGGGGGGSCENYAGIVRLKLCGIAVLVSLMQYSLWFLVNHR